MFDAYKVAVRLTLISDVAKQLAATSALFKGMGKEVDSVQLKIQALEARMKSLKKVAMGSAMAVGAGLLGFGGIKHAMGPGLEYAHQLNVLTMHGMKQKELAEATAKAWAMTRENMTTTPTQNLKTIMDLQNVLGHLHEAIAYAPQVAKIGTVLASSTEGKLRSNASEIAEGVAFAVAKGLDIRNAVGSVKEFDKEANMMTKVITAYGSRIVPEDYRQFFRYAKAATPTLSNEFLYEQLPTFMLEMKGMKGGGAQGGGFGNAVAMWYKFFVQGVMSKQAYGNLQGLGILPKDIDYKNATKTTTTGTMLSSGINVKNVKLAQENPFEYTQKVLLPAIWAKYGKDISNAQLTKAITDMMRGAPSTAIFAQLQFALKAQNVYRDQKIVQGAMDVNEGFKQAYANDPYIAMSAFHQQLDTLSTAFTMGIIPFVIPGLMKLSGGLNALAEWARAHPDAAKNIAYGIVATSAALVTFGTILGIKTMFAIIRTTAALNILNATLARTAGVAGAAAGGSAASGYMSGAGYTAAKAGGVGLLASLGFYGAAAAILGYGGYELYKNFASPGGSMSDQLHASSGGGTPGKGNGPPVNINIHADGKKIAQVMYPHFSAMLSNSNFGTSSSYVTSKSPPPVGTHQAFG